MVIRPSNRVSPVREEDVKRSLGIPTDDNQTSAERMRVKQNALINALRHSEIYQDGRGDEIPHGQAFEGDNSQINVLDYQYSRDEDDQVLQDQLKDPSDPTSGEPLRLLPSARNEDSPRV